MNIQFNCSARGIAVTYALAPGAHVPRVGEGVVADGSDPDFPRAAYEVTFVTTHVSHRGGPTLAVVDLRRIADLPQ